MIPVLLSRTPRLERQTLPPEIADLAEKQYLKFEHRNVTGDIEQLITALRYPDYEQIPADGIKPAHRRFWRSESIEQNRRVLRTKTQEIQLNHTAAPRSRRT